MEIINQFKKKGGEILWTEKGGRATWVGKPDKFLMDGDDNVYRCSEEEWENPPKGFIKMLAFFG